MLKIITKLFTKPEQIEDSSVELVVELPPKTRTELFDKAVEEAVKRNLREALSQELTEMCYPPNVVIATKEARDFYLSEASADSIPTTAQLREMFPEANLVSSMYKDSARPSLHFDLGEFIDRIIESANLGAEDE